MLDPLPYEVPVDKKTTNPDDDDTDVQLDDDGQVML
jgi:hypothetical protein